MNTEPRICAVCGEERMAIVPLPGRIVCQRCWREIQRSEAKAKRKAAAA